VTIGNLGGGGVMAVATGELVRNHETIGRANPLAATTYCLMVSAFNIPITYMLFVDGSGYARAGVAGAYGADAAFSLIASLLLGALLIWIARRRPLRPLAIVT